MRQPPILNLNRLNISSGCPNDFTISMFYLLTTRTPMMLSCIVCLFHPSALKTWQYFLHSNVEPLSYRAAGPFPLKKSRQIEWRLWLVRKSWAQCPSTSGWLERLVWRPAPAVFLQTEASDWMIRCLTRETIRTECDRYCCYVTLYITRFNNQKIFCYSETKSTAAHVLHFRLIYLL